MAAQHPSPDGNIIIQSPWQHNIMVQSPDLSTIIMGQSPDGSTILYFNPQMATQYYGPIPRWQLNIIFGSTILFLINRWQPNNIISQSPDGSSILYFQMEINNWYYSLTQHQDQVCIQFTIGRRIGRPFSGRVRQSSAWGENKKCRPCLILSGSWSKILTSLTEYIASCNVVVQSLMVEMVVM